MSDRPDPFGYAGTRVIVTGCASGIGAATARLLTAFGAEVHGVDWTDTEGLAGFHRLDLRDPVAIPAAGAAIGGRIDALFNCAGIAPNRDWLDVLRVNLLGTRAFTEAVVPLMQAGGAIVSVSSIGGAGWQLRVPLLRALVETGGFTAGVDWLDTRRETLGDAYRLSKEAINVWTLAQSARLMPRGIRINCTSPGTVQTAMLDEIEANIPGVQVDRVAAQIGRRSTPEEQAWPLLWLNSASASYVNGAILPADGGYAASLMLGG